jgi:hypothetical protein
MAGATAKPAKPKVQHLDHALACARLGRQHQVAGFHVAVHQALLVGVMEGDGGLADDLAGLGHREFAMAAAEGAAVGAVDELHHDEPMPLALARVVRAHDTGMIEPAHRNHFLLEQRHRLRGLGEQGVEKLQRDRAFHATVLGPVHRAKAPARHAALDLQFRKQIHHQGLFVLLPLGRSQGEQAARAARSQRAGAQGVAAGWASRARCGGLGGGGHWVYLQDLLGDVTEFR